MNALQISVLKRLRHGPTWVRSLGPYKPIADQLVFSGHIERVAPTGLKARNMLALTDKGRAALT